MARKVSCSCPVVCALPQSCSSSCCTGTLIFESKYANIEFKSLAEVVEKFIKDADAAAKTNGTDIQRPTSACFAVAGVVQANQCRLTNIDWVVDGDEMAKDLGIELGNLEIINDFVAQVPVPHSELCVGGSGIISALKGHEIFNPGFVCRAGSRISHSSSLLWDRHFVQGYLVHAPFGRPG